MDDKQTMLEQVARTGKALAHPTRLAILELLIQHPRAVNELVTYAGVPLSSLSAHLQVLRESRLVSAERSGTSLVYEVAAHRVAQLLEALTDVAQQDAPGPLGFAPTDVPHVTREDLATLRAAGPVTLVDVRPSDEFEASHLPGAVNVPIDQLPQRLAEIPADQPVIAYCRSRTCALGWNAVHLMLDRGLDARVLCDGVVEWRADDLLEVSGIAP